MTITIRPAAAVDHDVWLPLWQGYQHFYHARIDPATTSLTWQRFLDPHEPMHAALAFDDDRAVGIVHWIYHRSCWTQGDYVYLQDLFVAEDCRGDGIGRALIEHVYADARAHDAARVHWLTHETNHAAMQLYNHVAERSGFVQYRKVFG